MADADAASEISHVERLEASLDKIVKDPKIGGVAVGSRAHMQREAESSVRPNEMSEAIRLTVSILRRAVSCFIVFVDARSASIFFSTRLIYTNTRGIYERSEKILNSKGSRSRVKRCRVLHLLSTVVTIRIFQQRVLNLLFKSRLV